MTRQLLLNTNYSIDCNETWDLVFLKMALHKNEKDLILVTPSGRQAWDFSNDLVYNYTFSSKLRTLHSFSVTISPKTQRISLHNHHIRLI